MTARTHLHDAAPGRDPTGTRTIRVAFRGAGERRLQQVKNAFRATLHERDLLGLGKGPAAPMLGLRGRAQMFHEWANDTVYRTLVEYDARWTAEFIRKAYAKGVTDAAAEAGGTQPVSPVRFDAPELYTQMAVGDLQGIADNLVQKANREGSEAIARSSRSMVPVRALIGHANKTTRPRLHALANTLTVRAYNDGKLDGYRAYGRERVTVIPETLPAKRKRARDAVALDQDEDVLGGRTPLYRRTDLGFGPIDVMTAGDDKVCFPAGTLVRTISGDCPIEDISAGDLVLTRSGFRPVLQSMVRSYSGKWVFVLCDHSAFVCTQEHPIWCERLGFAQAGALHTGDRVQLVDKQLSGVLAVHNLDLGDMQDTPPGGLQRGIAFLSTFCARRSSTVPVGAIDFERDFAWKYEVDGVASACDFLLERYAQIVKGAADDPFRECFAFPPAITGFGAEPLDCGSGWGQSPSFSALYAGVEDSRTAALLRAIGMSWPTSGLLHYLSEVLAAAFADSIAAFHVPLFAGPRAKVIAIGNAGFDCELAMTSDAALGRLLSSGSVIASPRAEWSLPRDVLHASVAGATGFTRFPFGVRSTDARTEDGMAGTILGRACVALEALFAMLTGELERHVDVYNLAVAEMPEYFANGVLVHNCFECQALADEGPYEIVDVYGVLPLHVSCRCSWVLSDDAGLRGQLEEQFG